MFISVEGLDGSGKTTQYQYLVEFLRQRGYSLTCVREPGGTPIGDQIRDVLHSLKNAAMHPHTELLLYVASRAQLVAEVIKPRLAAGDIVLSDRYADSTLAYQGYGRGLDLERLHQIVDFATEGLKPDLTIYLDIDPAQGLARRQAGADKGEEWNRLDALALDFHQRVYRGYQALIAAEPQRWLVVDALGSVEEVQQRLYQALIPYLP
ncbi:MAG: dTMP kinase [Anaerolineales bacterium]|nr:dTMP kinase [Anaerolineales bacterium]